jgi:hypothetical protein
MIPVWCGEDIFGFAQAFLLYFRLQTKKGVYYDDRTCSTSFLQSIEESAYINAITTLLTCITNSYTPDNNGYLPSNLCVMGLAHQLHKTAKACVKSVLLRVNRTTGNYSDNRHFIVPIQGSPLCVYHMDGGKDAGGRDHPPFHDDCGGQQKFPPRSFPPGGCGGSTRPPGTDTPRGRFVCPDCNGRKWDSSLVCDACRRSGHTASQCGMLAMAIFIEKYMTTAADDEKDRIKAAWLKKWKGDLGNPTRNPRRVMMAYLNLLDTTVDNVDKQMCWECWPEDDGQHEPDKSF